MEWLEVQMGNKHVLDQLCLEDTEERVSKAHTPAGHTHQQGTHLSRVAWGGEPVDLEIVCDPQDSVLYLGEFSCFFPIPLAFLITAGDLTLKKETF